MDHGGSQKTGRPIHSAGSLGPGGITGSETQIARLEIEKLLSYVDFQTPVTDEDVYWYPSHRTRRLFSS